MKVISQPALAVLSSMIFTGNVARIDAGQLERKLYAEVNKALEALGGKWNRGQKGHVFPSDAAALVDEVIDAGGYVDQRKALGFFETPPNIAAQLVAAAEVGPLMRVLEPSAGHGAIIRAMPHGAFVDAVEIAPERRERLLDAHLALHSGGGVMIGRDFLTLEPDDAYDAVVMNPPFARGADVDHITHALRFLRPGGRLAAIASAGVEFREDKRTRDFRALVAHNHGTIRPLPEGSFASSGTYVRTVLVTMRGAYPTMQVLH